MGSGGVCETVAGGGAEEGGGGKTRTFRIAAKESVSAFVNVLRSRSSEQNKKMGAEKRGSERSRGMHGRKKGSLQTQRLRVFSPSTQRDNTR